MSGDGERMNGGRWCILRMSGPRTLAVVGSLLAVGLDAWTPSSMTRRRRPRSDKYRDVEAAILPTFAFARYEQLGELLALSHAPGSDQPPYTVLHYRDGFPMVTDRDLEPLREYEAQLRQEWTAHLDALARAAKRKGKKSAARAYIMGQRVRVEKDAFAGLVGEIVEIRKSGDLVLEFSGFLRGTVVGSCDVRPIQLSASLSEQTKAA